MKTLYKIASQIFCFFCVVSILALLMYASMVRAGELASVSIEPAAGAYLMLPSSDAFIYDTYKTGSHNIGTLDLHLVMEFENAPLHQVRVGLHHQSYINRGWPMNDRPETYIDGLGIQLVWRFYLWEK